jgi:hypothetical protein
MLYQDSAETQFFGSRLQTLFLIDWRGFPDV